MKPLARSIWMAAGLCVAICLCAGSARAGSDDFSITPPPVAAPGIEEGGAARHRLTGVSVQSETLSLGGGGYDLVGRYSPDGTFALSVQAGAFGLGGESTAGGSVATVSFGVFTGSLNLEAELFDASWLNAIVFGGVVYSYIGGTIDNPSGTDYSFESVKTGTQGGVQVGLKLGPFHAAPFFMSTTLQGTDTFTAGATTFTNDVEPYTATTVGMDILHTPSNISFSSALQQAAKTKTSNEMDVFIAQVSWSHQF